MKYIAGIAITLSAILTSFQSNTDTPKDISVTLKQLIEYRADSIARSKSQTIDSVGTELVRIQDSISVPYRRVIARSDIDQGPDGHLWYWIVWVQTNGKDSIFDGYEIVKEKYGLNQDR